MTTPAAGAAEIRNGARHLVAWSFRAYITGGFDDSHLAAVAAFRIPDKAITPSGLVVLTLWDEVRERVVEAAEVWAGQWLSESY